MVIKIAYTATPAFKYMPKTHPFPKQNTKSGRGVHAKPRNKWTFLKRVFRREMYTNWFGNTRAMFLVDCKRISQAKINVYNRQLRPLGFNAVNCRHKDVFPVFNAMGVKPMTNALRSSVYMPTLIVYAYGNELSPIGNVESRPLLRKTFEILERNKKTPDDFIVASMLDRQVMSTRQMKELLFDAPPAEKMWQAIGGSLAAPARLPSTLTSAPQALVMLLDHYAKSGPGEAVEQVIAADANASESPDATPETSADAPQETPKEPLSDA
jgi:hypothetical protein